jgi:hypothetical protein
VNVKEAGDNMVDKYLNVLHCWINTAITVVRPICAILQMEKLSSWVSGTLSPGPHVGDSEQETESQEKCPV